MPCDVGQDAVRAAELLRRGRLVAFATETVYGLGADALDERAVARVFEVKNRPSFDPMIVHVARFEQIEALVRGIPEWARALADQFWPGPLTIVLPRSDRVPDLVTAGLDTVGIRVPDHPMARALLEQCATPIAAPSANPFGAISPTTAEHVLSTLGDRIDYILDGGPCAVGIESSVISAQDGQCVLLRTGGIPLEDIEPLVGSVALPDPTAESDTTPHSSPGMLARHYAPNTPLRIVSAEEVAGHLAANSDARIAVLLGAPLSGVDRAAALEVLSPSGDLRECAASFFAALRRLDTARPDLILATGFPNHGLGRALNDRLRRAATGGTA